MPKYTRVRAHTSESAMAPPMLALPQDRAYPDEGRSFLRRDAVVLARSHRKFTQPVLLGELAESAEVRPRALRVARRGRHRHEPADVGIDLEQRGQLLGRHARLRRLAREVDLDERRDRELAGGGLRGEGVAELAQ